jgi:ABC-type transport system involved in multi-copper enzyme maturation permease subunit
MFSVVLAVGAAFLGAPAIAADVESGIVLAELPRPIRRADLILGKWLGLAALVVCYALVAGEAELYVIDAVLGYLPPHPFLAVCYLIGQALVLLTLAILCSTRLSPITGGIIAIVLFGLSWIAGLLGVLGSTFHSQGLQTAGTVFGLILPTDSLWRGAAYNLEPAALLALSNGFAREGPFYVPLPPTTATMIWILVWSAGALALAIHSFNRRDL